jgi:hypothetical protein
MLDVRFPDNYDEPEWLDRGFVSVRVVRDSGNCYELNFYTPEAIEFEIEASVRAGKWWTDTNVIVGSDLSRAAILEACAVFEKAGFTGLLPVY